MITSTEFMSKIAKQLRLNDEFTITESIAILQAIDYVMNLQECPKGMGELFFSTLKKMNKFQSIKE